MNDYNGLFDVTYDQLKQYLQHNKNFLNEMNLFGETYFYQLCVNNETMSYDIMELCLTEGHADLNFKNLRNGKTPLYWFLVNESITYDMVKLCVSVGHADLNIVAMNDYTPFFNLIKNKNKLSVDEKLDLIDEVKPTMSQKDIDYLIILLNKYQISNRQIYIDAFEQLISNTKPANKSSLYNDKQ